jgi:hypothetical protein
VVAATYDWPNSTPVILTARMSGLSFELLNRATLAAWIADFVRFASAHCAHVAE